MAEQGCKGKRVCTGFGVRVSKGKEGDFNLSPYALPIDRVF